MHDHPDALMIFAAGLGTRMAPLTATRPKPMISVAGRPLIDHALEQAPDVARIVANTHYLPDTLRTHLRPRGVQMVHEDRLLDTGGGLRNALPALGTGPVFTLNSDAVWHGPPALEPLRAAWNPALMDTLLLLIAPECALGHSGRGDFTRSPDGRITRGPGMIYSGAQIIRTDLLALIAEDVFSLNRLWDIMIARGRAHGVIYPGQWCDVGHPGGIALAETMLGAADV